MRLRCRPGRGGCGEGLCLGSGALALESGHGERAVVTIGGVGRRRHRSARRGAFRWRLPDRMCQLVNRRSAPGAPAACSAMARRRSSRSAACRGWRRRSWIGTPPATSATSARRTALRTPRRCAAARGCWVSTRSRDCGCGSSPRLTGRRRPSCCQKSIDRHQARPAPAGSCRWCGSIRDRRQHPDSLQCRPPRPQTGVEDRAPRGRVEFDPPRHCIILRERLNPPLL